MKRANCCSQTLYLSLHSDVIGHLPPVVSLFLRSDFLLLNVAPFLSLAHVYGTLIPSDIYLLTVSAHIYATNIMHLIPSLLAPTF